MWFMLCHLLELLMTMDSGCSIRTIVDMYMESGKGFFKFNLIYLKKENIYLKKE